MQETKVKRDEFSQAVLNTDGEGLAAYKKRRELQQKMAAMETDINTMKHDISEIKGLLLKILIRG